MTDHESSLSAPLIGIERHRLVTDGEGVTTLVAFYGCPLRCRYCINRQCLDSARVWRTITPNELVGELAIDNLYFLATGGGVTFGGGEPLLRSEFIHAFAGLCVPQWSINVETSLNVPRHHLEQVLPHVRWWIIDIKDTNEDIYRRYTGRDNALALANLQWLMQKVQPEQVTVRLPHIPGYNTDADVSRSRARLTLLGVTQFDEFTYRLPEKK